MSVPLAHGGLALESFHAVDDFVADCRAGRLSTEDRRVHGSHPLVVMIEGTLEAVTSANLSLAIIGLSRRSEALLVQQRHELEESDERPHLQQFLFSFEPLCQIVREAGYGGSDEGDSEEFVEDLFPEWLDWLVAWAASETLTELAERAGAARNGYLSVCGDIIVVS